MELEAAKSGLRYLDGDDDTIVCEPGDLSRTNNLGHNARTWTKIRMADITDYEEELENSNEVE